MDGAAAEVVAILALAITLGAAVMRPRGISEAVVAVPAAALVVVLGIVSPHDAVHSLREIGPTVGFLAAILVFGHLCADAGVFTYLGGIAARAARGDARRLLGIVVALAAGITATLTLDATVVLLTPVVLTTVAALGVPVRPHAYACTRLANSGSLLLPVSNLTNLLAFAASGLAFGRFTALMLLPWILVVAAEWLALRWYFRDDLRADRDREAGSAEPAAKTDGAGAESAPTYALAVLAVTVAMFVVASSLDVSPAFAALAGCAALLAPSIRHRDVHPVQLIAQASPGFVAFVLALAVIVEGITRHGLRAGLTHLVPTSTSFLALLGLAAVAAVLANIVNNLPATLAMVPVVAANPAWVLAVLIGVNIGPNATYPGSLATLLWRRLLPADAKPAAREFHTFGLLTVPPIIVLATAALWGAVQVVGV